MSEQKPTIGRVVHYVLADGEHRPALVVQRWGESTGVNLQVFLDGSNDERHFVEAADRDAIRAGLHTLWRTSVPPDEDTKKPGTWHWPERT